MTMYVSVTMMLTMPGRVNDDEDVVRISMIMMIVYFKWSDYIWFGRCTYANKSTTGGIICCEWCSWKFLLGILTMLLSLFLWLKILQTMTVLKILFLLHPWMRKMLATLKKIPKMSWKPVLMLMLRTNFFLLFLSMKAIEDAEGVVDAFADTVPPVSVVTSSGKGAKDVGDAVDVVEAVGDRPPPVSVVVSSVEGAEDVEDAADVIEDVGDKPPPVSVVVSSVEGTEEVEDAADVVEAVGDKPPPVSVVTSR